MAELIFDERLGQVAGTLAGVDGIRIWHDQALVKPAYGNHTAFHFDNPFWSFSSRDSLSLWVALDDATIANGCLWYLPRHAQGNAFEPVAIGENLGDIFKFTRSGAKYRPCRPIAPPAASFTTTA